MKKRYTQICGLVSIFLLAACGREVHSPQGFRLPDGDPDAGRTAFIELGCIQCHSVQGDTLPALDKTKELDVALGGEVRRVKTYAQLVTSIIYPSHIIRDKYVANYQNEEGESLMPDLTGDMTVRQLIDITQYLQTHYSLVLPEYPYDGYHIP